MESIDEDGTCVDCETKGIFDGAKGLDPWVCVLCGGEREPVELAEFIGAEEKDRPAPRLPWYLQLVYDSHAMLGKDPSGCVPMVQEQRGWLDEHHVNLDEDRRLFEALWMVVTGVSSTERTKRMERDTAAARGAGPSNE